MRESRRQRKEEEARVEAERVARKVAARHAAFELAQQTCPLPIVEDLVSLPGGVNLFDDEFIVNIARDWGFTTKTLTLTTHRLIHAKGIVTKDQEMVNLVDVTNVNYHKTMMMHGSIEIETSGDNSMTGLPRAKNARQLRDQLLALAHWAKTRPQFVPAAAPIPVAATAAASPPPDKFEQLKKLGELKLAGVLSDEEFAQEKAKLLSQ